MVRLHLGPPIVIVLHRFSGAARSILAPDHAPTTCAAGQPLSWADVMLYELRQNDTLVLPAGTTSSLPRSLSASAGGLVPTDPY
jgi:hypothetical protein